MLEYQVWIKYELCDFVEFQEEISEGFSINVDISGIFCLHGVISGSHNFCDIPDVRYDLYLGWNYFKAPETIQNRLQLEFSVPSRFLNLSIFCLQ